MSAAGGTACSGQNFHRVEHSIYTKQRGIKSVCGLLEITLDSDTYVTGVAFRAGKNHVVTAYHNFKECIKQIADNIAYSVDKQKKDEWPSDDFPKLTGDDGNLKNAEAILKFLQKSPTMEIKSLIKKFESFDEEGYERMADMLDDKWYDSVKFKIDDDIIRLCPNIPFADEENDVIILKTRWKKGFSHSFWFESQFCEQEWVDVIGYNNENCMVIDPECEVYTSEDKTRLKEDVEKAVKGWEDVEKNLEGDSQAMDFDSQYKLPEDSSGRFVMHTSHSFVEGTSGSPIISRKTEENRLVVHGMYIAGYPQFYYKVADALRMQKVLPDKDIHLNKLKTTIREHMEKMEKIENKSYIIPVGHFFEIGISMAKIASLIDNKIEANQQTSKILENMKRDIFPEKADDVMIKYMSTLAEKYDKEISEKKRKAIRMAIQDTREKDEDQKIPQTADDQDSRQLDVSRKTQELAEEVEPQTQHEVI